MFLHKILITSILLIAMHSIMNAVFYDFWFDELPEKRASLTIFKDTTIDVEGRIAIVGCSNLEHNIEFQEIRKSLNCPVDFYMYNGSAPQNYLGFIIENKWLDTSKYKTVVLYLPYICYDNSPSFQHRWGFYQIFASKDYVDYLFVKNKHLFFTESFIHNYYDLLSNRNCLDNKNGQNFNISKTLRTKYMDSLISNKTTYSRGYFPFRSEKFINKQTPNDINKYKFNSNVLIFLPPIPNIKENRNQTFSNDANNNLLNNFSESVRDSTLFYDQWYHLNYQGRKLETKLLTERIRQSRKLK
jgi:hypothetical protein